MTKEILANISKDFLNNLNHFKDKDLKLAYIAGMTIGLSMSDSTYQAIGLDVGHNDLLQRYILSRLEDYGL